MEILGPFLLSCLPNLFSCFTYARRLRGENGTRPIPCRLSSYPYFLSSFLSSFFSFMPTALGSKPSGKAVSSS